MSKLNKTGPMGQGPGTGRGLGSCGVGRPRLFRRIKFSPDVTYFKPRGVPLRHLEVVELSGEELEALRLKNIKELDQTECAKEMKTSQSTFQRILFSAYKKITEALTEGKAIEITKTPY